MTQKKNENRRNTPSLFLHRRQAKAGARQGPGYSEPAPATPAANDLNDSKLSDALLPISGSFLTRE
ncbi:hypothetical protein [Bradyrhizobium sp. Tv2a-2]|uniref:hypothetical protein n=1 Tax=Bradyrhizobium sp. Tv2a-2 TaxID=113395 RepID=UPI0012EB1FD8|nr:hypothetical protein [Bradyrhizobium sp. Tv2a-2]